MEWTYKQLITDNNKSMVPILDGNSHHVAHAWWKISYFWENKIQFVTALDLITCLKQIKKTEIVP